MDHYPQPPGDTHAGDAHLESLAGSDAERLALRAGMVAGAIGALLAAGVSLWAGQRLGGVITAQLLADRITGVTPVSLFGRALQALEQNAKPLTLLILTLAQVVAGAGMGAAFGLYTTRVTRVSAAQGALMLGALAWLALALVVAPLGQIGVLALDAPGGPGATNALFLVSAAVFGVITSFGSRALIETWQEASPDLSRRRFSGGLMLAAMAIPALVAGGYTARHALRLRQKSSVSPLPIAAAPDGELIDDNDPFTFAGMPTFVTPTAEFYNVSKNIVDPKVDGSAWSLEIDGLVERPLSLSMTDLLARESMEFTSTLECISNTVGGNYISTAVWRGFPLAELLGEAGLQAGIVDLELHAADGYVESIPVAEGLAWDTMVVHTMNGEPLSDKHGYPARLIVPGIYGMKNVKWLTKVTAVDSDIQGFWQQRGWSDPAPVLTMSRIDTPRSQDVAVVGQPFVAGGVAFAGDKGITRVEVSFDKGDAWHDAELSDVPSDLTWRLWRIEWTAMAERAIDLQVRATNGLGEVQTDERRPPLPDGSTGHHSIRLRVEGADTTQAPVPNTPVPDTQDVSGGDGGG